MKREVAGPQEDMSEVGTQFLQDIGRPDLIGQRVTHNGVTIIAEDFMTLEHCRKFALPMYRNLRELGAANPDDPKYKKGMEILQRQSENILGPKPQD